MTVSDTMVTAADPPLRDQVGDAASVLLERPGIGDHIVEGSMDLLTVTDPSNLEVMYVTASQSPDDWFDQWERHVGTPRPAKTWFVTTNEYARSIAAGADSTFTMPDDSLRVDTVSNPGDLTQLGVTITEQLKEYRRSDSDRQLVVCIRALDTLLQYAETETVFQFLHVLTGQIENAGDFAHYQLDPAAHDDRTVHTLQTLFDAVVSYGGDSWNVRTRS